MNLHNSIIFLYGRFVSTDFINKNKTTLLRAKNKRTKSGMAEALQENTPLATGLAHCISTHYKEGSIAQYARQVGHFHQLVPPSRKGFT